MKLLSSFRKKNLKFSEQPFIWEWTLWFTLWFGTRVGAEIIVHSTRQFLFSRGKCVIFKIYFKNAFNTGHRDRIVEEIGNEAPMEFYFANQFYRLPTSVMFGVSEINSQSGVQQRAPFGPLAFSLLSQTLIKKLRSSLNQWYLDDGTIGDEFETVMVDLNLILSQAPSLCLDVNPKKCEVFIQGYTTEEIMSFIQQVVVPGVRVLGAQDFELLDTAITPERIPGILREKLV